MHLNEPIWEGISNHEARKRDMSANVDYDTVTFPIRTSVGVMDHYSGGPRVSLCLEPKT